LAKYAKQMGWLGSTVKKKKSKSKSKRRKK